MKRIFRGIFMSLSLSLLFSISQFAEANAPVSADVIVVIDESGSMSGEQAWIREMIPILDDQLQTYGIGSESQKNAYGLVGYGNNRVVPRTLLVGGEPLGSASEFVDAARGLVRSGGTEDGWRGIEYALDQYPHRTGAAINIILATDEDRDNTDGTITYNTVLEKLNDNNALLNAVVNARIFCGDGTQALGMDAFGTGYVVDGSGGYTTCTDAYANSGSGNTVAHYVDLAVENGGAAWDLNFLRSGGTNAQSFTNALLQIKVQEILSQRPTGDLVAVVSATPNPAVANQIITLNGSQSYHLIEGQQIISWDWDLNNDGIFDVSGPIITTSFPELGTYPVTLRVTDDSDIPLTATANVDLEVNLPPLKPTAQSGGPYVFCPQNKPWYVDGSASANPDDGLSEPGFEVDQITSYAWDLDNDQLFDDAQGSLVDVTDFYSSQGVGDYLLRLQVEDNTLNAFPSSGLSNLTDISITQVRVRDEADAQCNCLVDIAVRSKMNKAQLTWTDSGAPAYGVYRSNTEGGPYELIAVTENRYSTYLDLGLDYDVTYYYTVAELNTAGLPVCRSREVSATPFEGRSSRNTTPTIVSTPVTAATEGLEYVYDVDATDPDRRETIEYTLQISPTGMAIDITTGVISWTPVNAQVGTQTVVVRAVDSKGAFDEQVFEVVVANTNQAPVISSVPETTATELQTYTYQTIAVDLDLGDSLTYSLTTSPTGMLIDSQSGLVTWTPAAGDAGSNSVVVVVTDSAGATGSQSFVIEVAEQNFLPQFTSTPNGAAIATESYSYQAVATDQNSNETLIYALGSFPDGMEIIPETGLISWTPTLDQIGSYEISVIVTDSRSGSSTQIFQLSVEEPNYAPEFLAVAVPDATEDEVYNLQLQATDANAGDVLTFSLVTAPANMTIDSATGLIEWLPINNQVGINAIRVAVADADGLVDEEELSIVVINTNDAPVINSNPITQATTGIEYSYQAIGDDVDAGDQLTWLLLSAPDGMTIDQTGLVLWTPTRDQSGIASVTIQLTDLAAETAQQTFSINVALVNQAPVISSTAPANVLAGDLYSYQIEATDPESDELTYALLTSPSGMSVSSDGLISWTPANSQIGEHPVELQVTDRFGEFDVQVFAVTVIDPNSAPEITSTPVSEAIIGTQYQYQITATDANGDAISFSLVSAPTGMTIDSFSGLVSWLPQATDEGIYEIEIQAADSNGATVIQSYSLAVNQAPNNPPSISSAPITSTRADQQYSYQIEATDPDGDVLAYSLTESPVGMTISVTGIIVWTPSTQNLGDHNIAITISDGRGAELTQSYVLNVTQQNVEPSIISVPSTTAILNELYEYSVVATDQDLDVLTYSLVQPPLGMSIDSASGILTWTPTSLGLFEVVVQVEDGNGGEATQTFSVVVEEPVNNPPVINSLPSTQALLGVTYQYQVNANDPESNSLTYQLTESPVGMTISTEGLLEWLPDTTGVYSIQLAVSDGENEVLQGWSLNVIDLQLSAEISISPEFVNDGDTVQIQVVPTDFIAPVNVEVTVDGRPIAIDSSFSSELIISGVGLHEVIATVTDASETIIESRTFIVVDPNDSIDPTASISSPVDGTEVNGTVDIVGTATDANLYQYQLLIAKSGTNDFSTFYTSQSPVSNGVLGQLNPSLYKNGLYRVLLIAEDFGGNQSQAFTDIRIDGGFKPGAVQLSFVDMTVPVAGIPIVIERTYDSREKSARDLGIGWDLSVRQGEYINNIPPGDGWTVESGGGFFNWPCSTSVEQKYHETEIRISENESYQFRPRIIVNGLSSAISGGCLGQAQFTQIGGVAGAQLIPIGNVNVFYLNATQTITYDLGDSNFGDPWVPQNVRLITPDGREFDLNLQTGITRVADQNDNQLFIGSNGVVNSSGIGVVFNRDGEGRITSITDPLGNQIRYGYDSLNNLVSFTNQVSEVSRYSYHAAPFENHLRSITLPDGTEISSFDYDEDGRLNEACNADGCSTAEYDLVGRTQTNYDATGRATTYVYDERGNVLSQTDALGNTHSFTYDADGNVIEHIDAEGNVATQTWDADGNMLSRTEPYSPGEDPADYTTTYSWNSAGNLVSLSQPNGAIINYDYDTSGNLTELSDETGFTLFNYTYSPDGQVLSETDFVGSLTYDYGSDGLVETIVDTNGVTSTFDHDSAGNITSFETDGVSASVELDAMGRELRTNYSDGSFTEYGYGFGTEWTSAEASGMPRVERQLSVSGKPQSITQADGSATNWEYDASGLVVAEVDGVGNRIEYSYDAAGRLVSETNSLGNTVTFERDGNGRVLANVDALGIRTNQTYTPDGRPMSRTDGSGREWIYQYTPNAATVIDELGRASTTELNSHGLISRIISADNTEQSWTYLVEHASLDGDDKPTSFTDEAGRVRNFSYDANARLVSATDFAGNQATYSYDSSGLIAATDAEGNQILFTRNQNGDPTSIQYPDGSGKTIEQNERENIITVTLASGLSKSLVYDQVDQLVADNRSNGETYGYVYDAAGKLTSATDSMGTNSYSYDSASQLTEVSASNGSLLSYEYDAAGRITSKFVGNSNSSQQASTRYEYDGAGRVTRIIDDNSGTTDLVYDRAGRLISKTLPNGIVTTYSYDLRDQISGITHVNASGVTLSSVIYTRAIGGEPTMIEWADGSFAELDYDSALRIQEERFYNSSSSLIKTIQYEYDLVGNRTAKIVDSARDEYSYSSGNLLQTITGSMNKNFAYTLDGQISEISSVSESIGVSYNFDGQPVSYENNLMSVSYGYDHAGQRTQKITNGEVKNYLQAPSVTGRYSNPQAVLDGDQNLLYSYVYIGDQPSHRISSSGEVQYYLTDSAGSVIGIADESGNLLGSIKYNAFGETVESTGSVSIADSVGGDFRFHGQWQDSTSGLYHMRARDYDASIGRFVSSDPAEPDYLEPESLNRYLYANANPYLFSDPSGRFTLVSVNIGISMQGSLRGIALGIVRNILVDKARSVVGSLLVGQLQNFAALAGYNPFATKGTPPWEAGKIWERKIRDFICDALPQSARDIVWFEPSISGGKATTNGIGCGNHGGTATKAGNKKPDFMLTKLEPKKLGDKDHRGRKAYLIGEVKLSLKTFHNAYTKGGYNIGQFNQIVEFAEKRVYSRTAVMVALYSGSSSHQKALRKLLLKAAKKKVVVVFAAAK